MIGISAQAQLLWEFANRFCEMTRGQAQAIVDELEKNPNLVWDRRPLSHLLLTNSKHLDNVGLVKLINTLERFQR
jgi:hypothetical protein